MLSRLRFLRCLVWDGLRYGRVSGAAVSRALVALARLRRKPMQRLTMLARAARLRPTLQRLTRMKPVLDACLDRIDGASLGTAKRNDIGKGIILKPPVSAREKGVLYLTFEEQWLRFLRAGNSADIAQRYDVVLGPSTSPPPQVEMLLMAKFWPGPLYTLLSNFDDAELLRTLSPKLRPVPLLASSWVDPNDFTPHLSKMKEYDLVMLSHFDPVKRHWLMFEALRKLPRSRRILLMGVPLGGRTREHLLAEACAFGVQDRFELLVRPSRVEVMSILARGRVSVIFSKQEGACIAVTESLFANTPVGLFREARIGSKAFINEQTGRLLDRRGLARQLDAFIDEADRYRPREWAERNISCHVSLSVLNDVLRRAALEQGGEWTRDLVPIRKDLVPSYLSSADETAMRPCYEDFAKCYGLLLGPAARPGWGMRATEREPIGGRS